MAEKKDVRKHTDEEMKRLACDLNSGHVFCDRQCRNPDDLGLVFTPLNFMTKEMMEEFKGKCGQEEIVFLYEYLDKAGPRSCNGMPMFFSMRMLNKADFEVMWGYYTKLQEAIKNL